MTMTFAHINEVLHEATKDGVLPRAEERPLPLPMGAGCVDPDVFDPVDRSARPDIDELVAFRCSS